MLRESDLSSKLAQVIEQIPKDVLYDFCCSYAQEHEELAMALVSEFWRPEKDDYRSMVQQCLMHPTSAGLKDVARGREVFQSIYKKCLDRIELPDGTDLLLLKHWTFGLM